MDLEKTKEMLDVSVKHLQQEHASDHDELAMGQHLLGGVKRALGDLEGAKESWEQELSITETRYGSVNPVVEEIVANYWELLLEMKIFWQAKQVYERALKVGNATLTPDHLRIAAMSCNQAGIPIHKTRLRAWV